MLCKLAFIALVAVLSSRSNAAISDFELEVQFEKFKIDFSRVYESAAEESSRKEIFRTNVNYIYAHNLDAFSGRKTFTLAVNNFTDLTNAEFRQLLRLHPKPSSVLVGRLHSNQSKTGVPASIDWVAKGAVTPPINQGQCGSSWAIPVVSAVEGQAAIKTGKLVALSNQQLIDCCNGNDQGCNGGSEDAAYECIIIQGGLDTAAAYPYTGVPSSCRFSSKTVGAHIFGWADLAPNNEAALENAVGIVGPVAGAVDASQSSFQFYSSGVYVEPACTQTVDHGISVVGYGTLAGTQYWKLKNSWGQAWGMGGYMLLGRNMNNMCGIASMNNYPLM